MGYLTGEQRETALAALAEVGAFDPAIRRLLLAGLPSAVVGHLDVLAQPLPQLRADLEALDRIRAAPDAEPLVDRWLRAAASLLAGRPEAAQLDAMRGGAWHADAPAAQPYAGTVGGTGSRPVAAPTDPMLLPSEGVFFAREADVRAALEALRDGRPAHLVGTGGVGKTEVARAVLRAWLDDRVEPAHWVALAGVDGAVGLSAALGEAAGDPRATEAEAALQAAARAPGLYYFDNLESVLDDEAAVGLLRRLTELPGVRVLTTSRVDPPLPGLTRRLDVLPDDAALALFQHGWAEAGGGPLDGERARRFVTGPLGGHPLAIVLLARHGALSDFGTLERRWAREGTGVARAPHGDPRHASLERSIRLNLKLLGRSRRPRLLWTLVALFPDGLEPRAWAYFERHHGLRWADREAAVRANVLRVHDGRLTVLPPLARFALEMAAAGKAGFSMRRARKAVRGWFDRLVAGTDQLEPTRGDLLAMHGYLERRRARPLGWMRDLRYLPLLLQREPLLARPILRAWAARESPPLIDLTPMRLTTGVALATLENELGYAVAARDRAREVRALAGARGVVLAELHAEVEAGVGARRVGEGDAADTSARRAVELLKEGRPALLRRSFAAIYQSALTPLQAFHLGLVSRLAAQVIGWISAQNLPPSVIWALVTRPTLLTAALVGDAATVARLERDPALRDDPITHLRLAQLGGRDESAWGRCREALRSARALKHPLPLANGLVLGAGLRAAAGDRRTAEAMLIEAIGVFGRLGHRAGAARAAEVLAEVRATLPP